MEDLSSTIGNLAALAHLDLDPEEKKFLSGQLTAILDAVAKFRELDTEGVEPADHVLYSAQVFREDEVKPSMPVGEVLQNAPKHKDNYIVVPRMLRKSSE